MNLLSRRDFLKIGGLAAGAAAFSQFAPGDPGRPAAAQPNVIILVLDAMSARDLSLYGYRRRTTPNFEAFAARANVYHAHHASGNYTTPGTASLLTGTYPWTHRALNIGGLVERRRERRNLFAAFGGEYHRLAFSQNLFCGYFIGQFAGDLETILPTGSFSLIDQMKGDSFPGDRATAYRALDNFLFEDGAPPASLVFGLADRILLRSREARHPLEEYPRGVPRLGNYPIYYRLADLYDGLDRTLEELEASAPYLAYLHLWAPHAPYHPTEEFDDLFQDNYRPVRKPDHRLGEFIPYYKLNNRRQNYDELIANVDAEFGRLMAALEARGTLESSYVVVTSDHGESFERGVEGHITKLVYEPLIHIPLLISTPGQRERRDYYAPTNQVDLLPTLLHVTGRARPEWSEGELLPGLGGVETWERSLFTVEAKGNPAYAPLTSASLAMIRGRHKLIHYLGYGGDAPFELYDLEADREELQDLYPARPSFAGPLEEELLETLEAVNSNYRKSSHDQEPVFA